MLLLTKRRPTPTLKLLITFRVNGRNNISRIQTGQSLGHMALAVVGRDAFLCRQLSVPVKFPMPALVGLSLSFTIRSTPALLESVPRMCSSAGIRSAAGGKGPRRGCCSSSPSPRPFSNCSDAEVLATSRSPWEDVLDSFVVDVVEADARALDVPLLAPFTIATTKLEKVHNVAICVALSDGSVGWGEAPTLPPVTAEDQTVALAEAARACGFLKAQPGRSLREILLQMSLILPGHDFASVCDIEKRVCLLGLFQAPDLLCCAQCIRRVIFSKLSNRFIASLTLTQMGGCEGSSRNGDGGGGCCRPEPEVTSLEVLRRAMLEYHH